MAKTEKKILIVGSSAVSYTLAEKMLKTDEVSEVFVAPGNDAIKEFCNVIDIREHNVQELLEFVLENGIDLTIAASEDAIKNDIATIFQQHNQLIFAPTQESAAISLFKSVGKKFMYKNRIPCAKFGIFDKPSMAVDYAQNANYPIIVRTEETQAKGVQICTSFSQAKVFIEELFATDEKKVLIEDYIFGHCFSFYVITDGYHAIPLGAVANYKHEMDGDGGLITAGMGAFVPDYRISEELESRIMKMVVAPTLNALAEQSTAYVGILGVDLVLTSDEMLFAVGFNPFLQSPDAQGILALLNENIYNLLEACAIGSFADDYDHIDISDKHAVSCVITGRVKDTIISGLDNLDDETQIAHFNTRKNQYLEYEVTGGRTLVLTRVASVLSKAISDLYDEISCISFDGMKYRKDIGKNIERI